MDAKWVVLPLAFCLAAPAAAEPSSEEYAQLASKTFSAWACAGLAEYSGNKSEAERLYTLGYDTGKSVVEAARAGKIEGADWSKHAPWIFGDKIAGPSVDFALGRMYEVVLKALVDEVWQDARESDDLRKTKAGSIYQKQNCSVLR